MFHLMDTETPRGGGGALPHTWESNPDIAQYALNFNPRYEKRC